MSFMLLGILNSQAAGGGGGSYDLIESQILSSSQTSITFSSLSAYASDYKHLQIRAVTRDNRAISGGNNVIMQFNGDTTGSNYYQLHFLKGDGSTVSSGAEGAASYILPFTQPSANDTTDAFAPAVIDLLDVFSSDKFTTSRSLRGVNLDAAFTTQVGLSSGMWMNTAALTEIKLQPVIGDFAAKTRISIYGVKGEL
tara:strand:- start:1353 stop:1943 length:591 start_codon:yes stop_codon:yes gene_type:complete